MRIVILVVVSVIIVNIGIFTGSTSISFLDALAAIFSGNDTFDPVMQIILNIRMPRVLLAFLAGGALSVSGAVVQSALKNPLASPYTIGISSGAAFAVGLCIATGVSIPFLGGFFLPVVGFLAGILALFSVIAFASCIDKNMSSMTVILAGMVFSLFYNAAQTVVVSLARDDSRKIIVWQLGSFAMRGWSFIYALLPFFIIGLICVMYFAKELDVMTLGDEQARSIGVNTGFVMRALLILTGVLTGSAVAVCGTIGFVDLITPHIARRIFGSRHAYVIPASALIGGTMMVTSDLIARTVIAPAEIPVGAVTAIIGAPFFAYIFIKGRVE